MIASCRETQAVHEGAFESGLSAWMRGEQGADAVAAGRIFAETIHMWRAVLKSKFKND